MLANAPGPLSAREIGNILSSEDEAFRAMDAKLQLKRVERRIYDMVQGGTAIPVGDGRPERRWVAVNSPHPEAKLEQFPKRRCLSRSELEEVRHLLPEALSDASHQAATREFLGRVSEQIVNTKETLTHEDTARFLSWHTMRIWDQMAAILPNRFTVSGCASLAVMLRSALTNDK